MMHVTEFTSKHAPHAVTVPDSMRQVIVEDGFAATPASSETVITVGRGSTLVYNWNVLTHGNHLRTITVDLAEHACAEFYGIVVGRHKHRVQLRLQQRHRGVSSVSRSWVRAIAQNMANIEVAGLIAIDAPATHADACLESRAIVLSKDARADMIPSLEILARDVQAKHAAASGPVDPEQQFYLTARGIEEHEARGLVLSGFVNALLDRLPQETRQTIVKERWNELLKKVI